MRRVLSRCTRGFPACQQRVFDARTCPSRSALCVGIKPLLAFMLDSRYLSDSMPFPISVSGVVAVRVVTVEAALDQLERALALQKASALQRQGNEVHFRGGAFRWVSNWNVLVPISQGVLHVHPRDDGAPAIELDDQGFQLHGAPT